MRVNQEQEFVSGGYTVGGSTFDALIFGHYEGTKLMYAALGFCERVRCTDSGMGSTPELLGKVRIPCALRINLISTTGFPRYSPSEKLIPWNSVKSSTG